MLCDSSGNPLRKRVGRNRLVPRPRRDLAQENLERLEIDPGLQLARRILRAAWRSRRHGRARLRARLVGCRRGAHVVGICDNSGEKLVVYHADLVAGESADGL